jgi:hypothetical protein
MRPQSGITIYERTSAISVADAKLKRPTMGENGIAGMAELAVMPGPTGPLTGDLRAAVHRRNRECAT